MSGLGVTLAATSMVLVGGTSPATAATVTKYGFSAAGFGTKVTSTDASLQSGMTAYSLIGCTKAAGAHNSNMVAASDLNDQVHAGSATTDQRSLVSAAGSSIVQSVTKVSSIEIGDDSLGFRITNLQGTSRAYATKGGNLNALSTFTFGSLEPLGGTTLPPPLDQPVDVILDQLASDGPVTIPGLGIVQLGHVAKAVGALSAQSGSIGLQVHLFGQDQANGGGDDSDVLIGRSYARITRSATHGTLLRRLLGHRRHPAERNDHPGPQPVHTHVVRGHPRRHPDHHGLEPQLRQPEPAAARVGREPRLRRPGHPEGRSDRLDRELDLGVQPRRRPAADQQCPGARER